MALLVATDKNGGGREYPLDAEETVIGRASGLPIRLDGANVSRRHARILRSGDAFYVEDLGSSNGTYLNERRISERTPMSRNDLLRIGAFVLRLETSTEDPGGMTIQRETAALPANDALYGENTAQKLQAVLQLAHELGNTLDMDTLLNRFFDQVLKLFPKTERAVVFFFEAGEPVVRLIRDRLPAGHMPQVFSRAVLRQVTDKRSAVLAADTRMLKPDNTLVVMGVRSLLCVPLQALGTPVFGGVQLERFSNKDPFTNDDLHLLTAVTLQAAMALDKSRMHEDLLRQERISAELALAREIQSAFLPTQSPVLPSGALDLVADLTPALEISGDFYDYFPLDDRRVLFTVADVSGKGMPAALFMSMVRALLRQVSKAAESPAQILHCLNDILSEDNPKLMFVTMVLGVFDVTSGACILARAGHPAPLLRRRDGRVAELSCHSGCLVGITRDCARFQETTIELAAGETLILYTDGLTEAYQERTGEMFGLERFQALAETIVLDAPLHEYVSTFRCEVGRFCAPARAQDDLTLLVLRRG